MCRSAIIGAKLSDAHVDSYKYEPMPALLAKWETIKNDNHSKNCHDQRKQFLLFVLSVDGMIRREDLVVLLQLSRVMSENREETLFQLRGWVNGRITIAVASTYSQLIWGARLPSPLGGQEPVWYWESGISNWVGRLNCIPNLTYKAKEASTPPKGLTPSHRAPRAVPHVETKVALKFWRKKQEFWRKKQNWTRKRENGKRLKRGDAETTIYRIKQLPLNIILLTHI